MVPPAPFTTSAAAPVYQPKKVTLPSPSLSAPASSSAFPSSNGTKSAFGTGTARTSAFGPPGGGSKSAFAAGSAFQKAPSTATNGSAFVSTPVNGFLSASKPSGDLEPKPTPAPPTQAGTATSGGGLAVPDFFRKPEAAPPKAAMPSITFGGPPKAEEVPKRNEPEPARIPFSLDKPTLIPHAKQAQPPSTTSVPRFFNPAPTTAPVPLTPIKPLSPPRAVTPLGRRHVEPEINRIKVSRQLLRHAPALLGDELISAVVASLVDKSKPRLEKIVQQQEAAEAYTNAKVARRAAIERYAGEVVERMLQERIEEISYSVYHSEQRVRHLTREIAEHWRSWATRMQHLREVAELERQQTVKRLRGMGLARSIASYSVDTGASSAWSVADSETVTLDELDIDEKLQEAEQARDQLFTSSTFMTAIARAVTRHLRPLNNDDEPTWETVLLSAEHAGTPAAPAARDWLESKFVPPTEVYHSDGVDFTFNVADVHGEFPGSTNTGLYVFEAPMDTINSVQRALNQDDAGDRLDAAAGAVQQCGRYRTALLILTWEYETLEDVVGRLGIQKNIEQFDSVAAVSLEDAEELDVRFAEAVRSLVPIDPRKVQVTIPMEGKREAHVHPTDTRHRCPD